MNPTIHPTQSNTRAGIFPAVAGSDLRDKEGRVVVLASDGQYDLPANIADPAEYLLLEGGNTGEPITVAPLDRARNWRIRLKGTCDPGDRLVLAAIAGDDAGKLRKLPAANGTYHVVARAESAGVDGQLVLCRPTLTATPTVINN
ncbi:MAG TPA: hypothetical protein PLA50_10325 [Bacteroidia bacterium]|nr:hypothetical protein [Bacteroidia bacterium]